MNGELVYVGLLGGLGGPTLVSTGAIGVWVCIHASGRGKRPR
jgi:hypothetical protein